MRIFLKRHFKRYILESSGFVEKKIKSCYDRKKTISFEFVIFQIIKKIQ